MPTYGWTNGKEGRKEGGERRDSRCGLAVADILMLLLADICSRERPTKSQRFTRHNSTSLRTAVAPPSLHASCATSSRQVRVPLRDCVMANLLYFISTTAAVCTLAETLCRRSTPRLRIFFLYLLFSRATAHSLKYSYYH